MKVLRGLLAFGAVVLGGGAILGCGGGGSDDNGSSLSTDSCSVLGEKIFNGTECRINNSPIVAYTVEFLDTESSLCSGTLISPTKVLTAGHCIVNGIFLNASVRINGRRVNASRVRVHPGYFVNFADELIFNDAAILILDEAVSGDTLPILVSKPLFVGDVIDIFGFGQDESGRVGTLKSGQMRVDQVNLDHIFSEFGDEGSNTCFGDSGGPSLSRTAAGAPAVSGITSTGSAEANCRQGDISVFTQIQETSTLNFIRSIAPEASYE